MMKQQAPIVQRGNEVFLLVGNRWFVYNLAEPPLGAGAMGTVYLGRSCDNPGLKVAIKRVADAYTQVSSIRERARLEASLLFRHPHLVEMVGYCEYAPNYGPIFVISHLVQGVTLDKYVNGVLRSRKDAIQRICQSMYPVLDALDYLHDKQIVHLDIKPSNIMVENGCNIRLMDLGIAYSPDLEGLLTKGLVGTPQYAAPEQYVNGSNGPINSTTDIYEAGVTLYELLANYNPYDGPTVSEMVRRHSEVELTYVEGVPKSLVNVLRKATAVNQENRFQTAKEFKAAIIQTLAEKPVPWWKRWF